LLRAGFSHRRTVLMIYAFTQWLAALALVAANAEMRFLWLALATAVLVWVVVRSRRQQRAAPQTSTNGSTQPSSQPVSQRVRRPSGS
jgi:UDP-GlcNAc:undecaprenyl-phosphate GlcNAc-1-phosphate transferase